MKLEKMILYLLRNGENLTKEEIEEIIASLKKNERKKVSPAIKQLIKSLDVREKEGQISLLSKAQRKMLKINDKVSHNQTRWNRRWTMVLFDIPERNKKTRDMLRYQLKNLGFGMMQGSVWVKPADLANGIRRTLRLKNLQWQVKVLSFNLPAPDEKETIHRIWKMERLNQKYFRFIGKTIKRFRRLKNYPFANDKLKGLALDLLSRMTEKEYLNLYAEDPQLPTVLTPKDWNGQRAYNIYRQLDKYLVRN